MKRLIVLVSVLLAAVQSVHADQGRWPEFARADFNGDCVIDVIDQQSIAFRYGAVYGDLYYDTRFDLEPWDHPDYDIDIKDLQKVWGRTAFTCLMF